MTARGRLVAVVVAGLTGCLLLAGCAALPESGPVRRVAEADSDQQQGAPYFRPPGPRDGSTPTQVVSDFLTAMQANPLSTSVAREFLSERARQDWRPGGGTVVYEAATVRSDGSGVTVRLTDPRRLDSRGGWQGAQPGTTDDLELTLVEEKGEWRIEDPPDALVVPTSFFDRTFARFNLYFYDQTGRTLLPDPVFIPRGEQSATNLVRGLLAGPGAGIADVTRSALPSGTTLDLSVVVTESGVAEVPLSRDVQGASRGELARIVDQLAWTLRQVPGIESVRLTVGGTPVPLPNGRIDAPVGSGQEYDAAGTGAAFSWGLRGGRVVDLGDEPVEITGPFGRPGYSLRSFAVSESPRSIAAVSTSGGSVYVGPADAGRGDVLRVVDDGTDVLRPQYDMFGDLWLVDRTPRGAEVMVVRGRRVRVIDVPGVTGQAVAAFSVARDGSRIAFAYPGTPAPDLRVVDILRTDEGRVSGTGTARVFADGRADAARVIDLGWRDPATLAVLSRPSAETSEVTLIGADGAPVADSLPAPNVFRGVASALVVSPDADLPMQLITPGQRLYTVDEGGAWPRSSSRVVAAAYVR